VREVDLIRFFLVFKNASVAAASEADAFADVPI
jgi:hypothetical protein